MASLFGRVEIAVADEPVTDYAADGFGLVCDGRVLVSLKPGNAVDDFLIERNQLLDRELGGASGSSHK